MDKLIINYGGGEVHEMVEVEAIRKCNDFLRHYDNQPPNQNPEKDYFTSVVMFDEDTGQMIVKVYRIRVTLDCDVVGANIKQVEEYQESNY